jgi:cytochrome b
MPQAMRDSSAPTSHPVWDLPVRLFHWALVALILVSFVTAQIGGNAMQWHEWSGLSVLALLLFRLLWGLVGSTYARFGSFVRGPRAALAYARALLRGEVPFFPGHNPLGGWMIVLLLASLLLQAGTGLFANDDVMIEGPFAQYVTKETSDLLTRVHHFNFNVLATLVALHVAAALFYLFARRENLILPMLTGRKPIPPDQRVAAPRGGPLWLAAALFTACVAAVYLAVR